MQIIKHSDIQADVDVDWRSVTLRLRHFDSQFLADFVTKVLPQHGVLAYQEEAQADDDQTLLPAPFQLALLLGGRRHPASVVRLTDGRTTVRLEEPSDNSPRADVAAAHLLETGISYSVDEMLDDLRSMTEKRLVQLTLELKKRWLESAATRALQILHELGWMAIVTGDLPNGVLTSDSMVEVLIDDRERVMTENDFAELRHRIEAGTSGAAFIHRASSYEPATYEAMFRLTHLTWDTASKGVKLVSGHNPGQDDQRVSDVDLVAPMPHYGSLRRGVVSRLNGKAGFGYVDDDDGVHCYIFVFGHAIRHSDARQLSIGDRVCFWLEERGRVKDLRPD